MQKINKLYSIPFLRFFDRWGVNVIRLLLIIPKRNQYIIIVVKYLSK